MLNEQIRYMRIIVMFDLPTETKADKRQYTDFRRLLVNSGYNMLQYSVYQRICPNLDQVQKQLKRLESNKPKTGSVRAIVITNKQYEDTLFLTGHKSKKEKYANIQQFTLF